MKKPYNIHITCTGDWWSAICPELGVSGFGSSREKAIEAVRDLPGPSIEGQLEDVFWEEK